MYDFDSMDKCYFINTVEHNVVNVAICYFWQLRVVFIYGYKFTYIDIYKAIYRVEDKNAR